MGDAIIAKVRHVNLHRPQATQIVTNLIPEFIRWSESGFLFDDLTQCEN